MCLFEIVCLYGFGEPYLCSLEIGRVWNLNKAREKNLVRNLFRESGCISGQFLAGYLAGLAGEIEKKNELLTALNSAGNPAGL